MAYHIHRHELLVRSVNCFPFSVTPHANSKLQLRTILHSPADKITRYIFAMPCIVSHYVTTNHARCRAATISLHGRNSSLSDVVLIRLKHDDGDDTSPGGHAKIDCQGDGDADDHGNRGEYGEIMANIMVFVMAMAMMTAMADGTQRRS